MSTVETTPLMPDERVHVKSFRLKVDSVDETAGTFDAYASVFNVIDSDAEIVLPGAFDRSLKNNQAVVVLADHDVKSHIGFNVSAREDGYGLRVQAQLALDNSVARDKYALIKLAQKLNEQGYPVKAGISIGFRAIQTKLLSGRELKSVKGVDPNRTYKCFVECALIEYSVVALPANQEAYVTAVKAKYDAEVRKHVAIAIDDSDDFQHKADAKTKRVAGEDLTADCFAYVGDPDKTETWKLPIKFSSDARTERHIRNALARFGQTQGIPDSERAAVLAKIRRAAKEHGIDTGDGKAQKDFNDSLAEAQAMAPLYEERCEIERALCDATTDATYDDTMSADDKKADIAASYAQYAAAMSDWYSRFIDADTDNDNEEDLDEMDGKQEKAGRAISAASAQQIKTAMGHLMDAGAMHQKALGILTDLSKQPYTANDVNADNPVGGGKSEAEELAEKAAAEAAATLAAKAKEDQEKSDSEALHSLLELTRSVADRSKAA